MYHFYITIIDTLPQSITVPLNIVVEAYKPGGGNVNYPPATAYDIVDGNTVVSCLSAPGSSLTINPMTSDITTVRYSSTDFQQNSVSASFTIAIRDSTRLIIIEISVSDTDTIDGLKT